MATRISERTIEEIRARTDIVQLVGERVELRRSGSGYMGCCPFHNEKTPSFSVNPAKGFYHCFGCGKSGDAFTFLMETEGLSFTDAVKRLGEACGIKVEEEDDGRAAERARLLSLHSSIAAFFAETLASSPEAAAARAYLSRRSLSGAPAEMFGIGYCTADVSRILSWAARNSFTARDLESAGIVLPPKREGGAPFNRFGGRIMFPIRDRQGRTIAFSGRVIDKSQSPAKYVNSPETPVFSKSKVLYALDLAAKNIVKSPRREAIVCEGQIDVIRCHACGFPRAVASQGTSFTADHVEILKRVADSAVLLFDGDAAGRKAAARTAALFIKAEIPVRVASLPKGEDPDSFRLEKGPDAFNSILENAESSIAFHTRILRESFDNPDTAGAVQKTAAAVLETIAGCPGAVLRAALLAELSAAIGIPQSALADDLERMREKEAARRRFREGAAPAAPKERGHGPAYERAPQPEEDGGDIPESLDAASESNNPPPPVETAFCEFLVEHEGDAGIAAALSTLLPQSLGIHPFTRKFVDAWMEGATGEGTSLAGLFGSLSASERDWMEAILSTRGKTNFSELTKERVLADFLRSIWSAEATRRRMSLPAASSPETDTARLAYTLLAREYSKGPWDRAKAKMNPAALEITVPAGSPRMA